MPVEDVSTGEVVQLRGVSAAVGPPALLLAEAFLSQVVNSASLANPIRVAPEGELVVMTGAWDSRRQDSETDQGGSAVTPPLTRCEG